MPVREQYSHAKADRHKEKKRKEAGERKEVRAGRTDQEQLQRLAGHSATKEKKRLRARIKASQTKR